MFANLKQGSQMYILHPNVAVPFVEVGTVETISNAIPMVYYPNLPTYPMDMTVKVGDKSIPLQRLPTNAESATVTASDGESIIIACSKDAINNEVEMMKQKSIEVVNSVEYHKQRIVACDNLIKQLNPEVAEKEAQAKEINDLKAQLSEMNKLLNELRTSSRVSKTKE